MATVMLERDNPLGLEERIEAFESAWNRAGAANPADFLPTEEHPSYPTILCELVRVDLELNWTRGKPKPIEDYIREFPLLRNDSELLQQITYEEYRQRLQAGESVHPAEYAERFDVNISAWPSTRGQAGRSSEGSAESNLTLNVTDHEVNGLALPPVERSELARLVKLQAKEREASKSRLPRPGEKFASFHIVEEIGRGSFGRVFKARQLDLAEREVALKVSLKPDQEPQQLAQLQHTNIMPIFSMHRVGSLQAVCMPLLGSTTLADLIRGLKRSNSLPTSGRILLSTLFERGRTRRNSQTDSSILQSDGSEASASFQSAKLRSQAVVGENDSRPVTHLEQLASMSLVEAALSLMTRVADGLAHAHARGILHRDLKPANILITDDGEPMLLDFNLALNVQQTPTSKARMGGTLPYMAPEQLAAFRKGERISDVRCDLYAIGMMLYELMTGIFPYKVPKGKLPDVAEFMAKDRQAIVPDPRRINPAISPAVASIVKKLLAPNPAERYQSATELKEDLERQLSHRPLKFAPEPSLWERFSKFRHRNPRLCAAASVAAAAMVLIVLPVGVAANEHSKSKRLTQQVFHTQSLSLANRSAEEARQAQICLQSRHQSSALRKQGSELVEKLVNRYGIAEDGQWVARDELQKLTPEERSPMLDALGYAFLAMADTSRTFRPANAVTAGKKPPEYWAKLAEQCLQFNGKSGLLKLPSEQPNFEKMDLSEWDNADLYAQASLLVGQGQYGQALKWLAELLRRDPQFYMGWHLNALCHEELGRYHDAETDWTVCITLQPNFERGWAVFSRGSLRLNARRFVDAKADFDEALNLNPRLTQALINRSLAWRNLGRLAEAEADLSTALTHDDPPTYVWLMRSVVRSLMGKKAEAAEDKAKGLKLEPEDDRGWVTRGWARMDADPEGALADFEQALRLNPRCRHALQNKTYVYGEILRKNTEALAANEELVKHYPDYVPGRAGRGVYRARLGDVKGAKQDAEFCLAQDRSPFVLYQMASLYSQLTCREPQAKSDAFELLGKAIRGDVSLAKRIETDKDFDSIRKEHKLQELVEPALKVGQEGR
ncbi:MAG TPA: serine/threonine-protein kinase [Gemmataceae bacterium]|nr:serine/threonine-protein kinase [Gemmataceae bacterium]